MFSVTAWSDSLPRSRLRAVQLSAASNLCSACGSPVQTNHGGSKTSCPFSQSCDRLWSLQSVTSKSMKGTNTKQHNISATVLSPWALGKKGAERRRVLAAMWKCQKMLLVHFLFVITPVWSGCFKSHSHQTCLFDSAALTRYIREDERTTIRRQPHSKWRSELVVH